MLEATSFFDADALKGRMSPQVGEKRPQDSLPSKN